MTYNFIHGIVFTAEEYEDYKNEKYFSNCACGDYIVHALVNADTQEIIIRDDNIHQPIEEQIESFLAGVTYKNQNDFSILQGLFIVPNNPYSSPLFSDEVKFIKFSK